MLLLGLKVAVDFNGRLPALFREASFQYVKAVAALDVVSKAEIKLCIATKADRSLQDGVPARPSWLDQAREWCTNELFEYIEVSSSDV